MTQYILPSLVNGFAVFVGLFALWSFATGMKHQPTSSRAQAASLAAVVSAALTFVITAIVGAGTA